MPNIAIILNKLDDGGSNKIFLSIVKILSTRGFKFTLFHFSDNLIFSDLFVEIHKLSFFKMHDFNKYDVIHSHGPRPSIYLFFYKRFIKVKTIETFHSFIFDEISSRNNILISFFYVFIWLFCSSFFNYSVFLTEYMRNYYINRYYFKKTFVINNGISQFELDLPVGITKKSFNIPTNKIIIGCIGRLVSIKGFDQIIKSLVYLPDYALVIVGEGPELNNLIEIAKLNDLSDRVFFIGNYRPAYHFFNIFDIFCMPSKSEGFGLVLLEAARSKVPIVANNIATFRELFNSTELVFCHDHPFSYSLAFKYAYNNRTELIKNSYVKFITHYTDKIMSDNYQILYESIINNNSEYFND